MKKQKTITDYINKKNILIILAIVFLFSLIGQGILFYKINKLNKAIILNNKNTKANYELSGKLLNFTCALTGDIETCKEAWKSVEGK